MTALPDSGRDKPTTTTSIPPCRHGLPWCGVCHGTDSAAAGANAQTSTGEGGFLEARAASVAPDRNAVVDEPLHTNSKAQSDGAGAEDRSGSSANDAAAGSSRDVTPADLPRTPADTKPNITGECAYCDWPACAAVGGVNVCMVHIITEPVRATEPTCRSYGAGHRCTLPEGHDGAHHFDTPLNTTTDSTCHPNATSPDDCPKCGARDVFNTTTCPHGCDGTGDEPDCPRHGATSASMPPRDTTTNKTNCELCMEAGIAEERARIERIVEALEDHDGHVYKPSVLAAIRGGDDA
jgi:hypothetical protein